MALDRDLYPWPRNSSQHELRSIRHALAQYSLAPSEMRLTEIEGGFGRPSIQFTLLNQRVQNRSQFDFQVMKNLAITYFASSHIDLDDQYAEALEVADWLSEFFGRYQPYHGPIIPIYDFSGNAPVLTDDWIDIDSATVDGPRKDTYGLQTVPINVVYGVSRDEVNYSGDVDSGVLITGVQTRTEIT